MTLAEKMARKAVGGLEEMPSDDEIEAISDTTVRDFLIRGRQLLTEVQALHPNGESHLQKVSVEVSWFAASLYAGTRIALGRAGGGIIRGEPGAEQCEGRLGRCLDPATTASGTVPVLCHIDYIACMAARLKSLGL